MDFNLSIFKFEVSVITFTTFVFVEEGLKERSSCSNRFVNLLINSSFNLENLIGSLPISTGLKIR